MNHSVYKPGGVELKATAFLEKARRSRRLFTAWLKHRCGLQTFVFDGVSHTYFLHSYNQTWSNERTVEIAIANEWLRKSTHGKLLEVGNVLSHYRAIQHDVLDKYEFNSSHDQLIQKDFLTFLPSERYEAILSISTFEHIGRDEEIQKPELAIEAIHHVPDLLEEKGRALITFAAGYNRELDEFVRALHGDRNSRWRVGCLKRISFLNWVETKVADAITATYGTPFPCGNVVLVLRYGG